MMFIASEITPRAALRQLLSALEAPAVLDVGTARSDPEISTKAINRASVAPHAGTYVGFDIQAGEDVDVTGDVHHLADAFGGDSLFDAVVCICGMEHFQHPWTAACELVRMARPGGSVLIETHFAFQEHNYPADYWRFTTAGLRALFCDIAGAHEITVSYQGPGVLVSEQGDYPYAAVPVHTHVCGLFARPE